MRRIVVYPETELDFDVALPIATLANLSFFKSRKSVKERVDEMLRSLGSIDPERVTGRRFVTWQGSQAIAHARTFVRHINTDAGSIPVLALASVCTDPEFRGQGLGAEITRKAFEQIGKSGWPVVSLFQTPAAEFYKKLNCRVVTNRFVNRLCPSDPESHPWRDDTVMIYPAEFVWPEGTIDLNGPDY